ncbi:MAG: cupin domain-containing protein [Dactylosporangium sp.]|nr:cupin domain-containing protein [Dactylosporangium sp.]
MTTGPRPPAFPGGTSVSRLSVYPDPCRDGLHGGTPHLHLASTEAYVVVGGEGALHTVDRSGFRETELRAGSTVWFTPGTIHRAVNRGGLEVVVVMSNAGLPEAGDAAMTFPPEVVADPRRYRQAASLPAGAADDVLAAAVRRRRDLAGEGFRQIVDAVESGDFGPLERLYACAVALVRPAVARWREIWEQTVARQTQVSAEVLDALERGDGTHLSGAELLEAPPSPELGWGMCGRLRTHDVAHPLVPGSHRSRGR